LSLIVWSRCRISVRVMMVSVIGQGRELFSLWYLATWSFAGFRLASGREFFRVI
jgi:hypothetical protein